MQIDTAQNYNRTPDYNISADLPSSLIWEDSHNLVAKEVEISKYSCACV